MEERSDNELQSRWKEWTMEKLIKLYRQLYM
jgi:hypothetical protein